MAIWRRLLIGFVALLLLVLLIMLGFNRHSLSVDLPAADASVPPPPGLSAVSSAGLNTFLDLNALSGSRSGFIALFARDGHIVHATTAGYADLAKQHPMTMDTRVRIASMTKPVTAVAALMLIEEGRLQLDDPVALYIPAAKQLRVATDHQRNSQGELSTEALRSPLTVRHLLLFSAGIGGSSEASDLGTLWREQGLRQGEGDLATRVNRVMALPLFEQPNIQWRYGWSADVLARVVEVAAGQPFDDFLQRSIFTPLGMQHTEYLPPLGQRQGLATVYTQDEKRHLIEAETIMTSNLDWTPGGSGLVSTASDYMRFALMLWNQSSYNGVQILSPATVKRMPQPHVADGVLSEEDITGLGWGLGMAVVVDAAATPMTDRDGDFWWSGYLGTTFFVSPSTGLVGVVLSQNQPGPYSGLPLGVYLAQSFAFFGL